MTRMTRMTSPTSFLLPTLLVIIIGVWVVVGVTLGLNLHWTIHVVDASHVYDGWRLHLFSIDTSLQIVVQFVRF
jgi:hypothetical protein